MLFSKWTFLANEDDSIPYKIPILRLKSQQATFVFQMPSQTAAFLKLYHYKINSYFKCSLHWIGNWQNFTQWHWETLRKVASYIKSFMRRIKNKCSQRHGHCNENSIKVVGVDVVNERREQKVKHIDHPVHGATTKKIIS